MSHVRYLRAAFTGLIAGVSTQIVMFILFLFSMQTIILNPEYQSPKLIAVWTSIEPLPHFPTIFVGGIFLVAVHAFIYAWIREGIPGSGWHKGIHFGIIIWALQALFFEFFTPFSLFGEPVLLVFYELILWFITTQVEGILIWYVYEDFHKKQSFENKREIAKNLRRP